MEVIERAAQQSDDELIRFAALVHDFGKIATPKNILPHHYNHENNGDAFVVEFCKRLKLPNICIFWFAFRHCRLLFAPCPL